MPGKNLVQYPGAGCVVEFMQGNAAQLAWIMEEQAGKLRLLLPNRREMNLQLNRLLPWTGPQYNPAKSRDEAIALMNEHKSRRDGLAAAIDPIELWEMTQGEMESAQAQWIAELVYSDPDIDIVAACGHRLLECKSHFKFQPPVFEIYTGETVEARQQAEAVTQKKEELVGGGAAWFRSLWESRVKAHPRPAEHLPPENVCARLQKLLRDRILDPETQEDDALWKQVSKGLPDDPHLPLLLAMTWGLVPEHYNYWLARADYSPSDDWHAEFTAEIDTLRKKADSGARTPLALPFISVDSASTRDIDDAFHVAANDSGGWHITTALACPVLDWTFGGPLDKAVAGRATSLYLPEGHYHMLPSGLGTGVFSLHADQICPALTLACDVSPGGGLDNAALEFAWVKLAANLNYADAEKVLPPLAQASAELSPPLDSEGAANPAEAYRVQLNAALALAEARQRQRVKNGAVIIERGEAEFYLTGQEADTEVFRKETPCSARAQFLVSEIMILVNAAIAEWAIASHIPLLFRSQDVGVPREFAGVWSKPQDIARVIRAMAPASLDTVPRPHAGMGLPAYITVTSPLRRYPDMINEAQALNWLNTGRPRWTEEELKSLLNELKPHLEAAGLVQRFRPRYWKFVYIQQQARKHGDAPIWEAVISEENDHFVQLYLEKEQLSVRAKRALFGEKVFPGQKFMVRLGKINALRGEVSVLAAHEAEPA